MKKRIRHFSKSTLSIVLSLCMLISCVSVGLIATDAAQISAGEKVGGGRDWQGNIFFRAPDGWDLTSYPYIQVWAVQSDSADSGEKYAFKLSNMSIVGTTSNSRLYHCNISTKIDHSSWNDEYIAFTANTSNWDTGDFYISTCGQYTKPLAYTACNTNGSYLFSPSDSSNNTATNNNTISGEFNGTGRDVLNKNQDFYVYTNGSSSATGGTLGVVAHYLNGSNYNGSSAIAGNEITVNSDDTDVHETYTAVEGTKVTLTANASTGYKLDGIYDAATGGNEITSPYYVLGTKSVYARFSPQSYTITYKDGGDTAFSGTHASGYPTTHTYGTATNLKTASKTGYTFDGWFTNSSCTGSAVTSLGATAYTSNITLYAKWTIKSYDITFSQPEHGSIAVNASNTSPVSVNHGTNATVAVTPASGYKIKTLTDNDDAIAGAVGCTSSYGYTITGVTDAHTIVAEMESAGVCGFDLDETEATLDIGGTTTFTATPNAYHVGGTISAVSSDTSIATVSRNNNTYTVTAVKHGTATITVSCTEGGSATFTVTVNTPTISISADETELNIGETATLTPTVTHQGTAAISYTSSDATVVSISGTTIKALKPGTANITATIDGITSASLTITVATPTLNVVYSPSTVFVGGYTSTVTVTADNANAESTIANTTFSKSGTAGTINGTTGAFTSHASTTGEVTVTVTGDVTFNGVTYTGATGTATITVANRPNIYFDVYPSGSDDSQGGYMTYNDAATNTVSDSDAMVFRYDKALSASSDYYIRIWDSKNNYQPSSEITDDVLLTGTGVDGTQSSQSTKLTTAAAGTYHFYYDYITHKFYVEYPHTVTYNANGHGTAPAAVVAEYDATITAPTAPTAPTGYQFDGWYKEDACTNVWDFSADTVTDDTTLYAKWTKVKYTVIYPETTTGYNLGGAKPTQAEYGDTISFTVAATSGYRITGVTYTPAGGSATNATAGSSNEYHFTMPDKNVTVNVSVVRIYTVTLTAGTGFASKKYKIGSGSSQTYNNAFTVDAGSIVTFEVTYSNGYELNTKSDNVTASNSDKTFTTGAINADTTVTLTAKKHNYTLTGVTSPTTGIGTVTFYSNSACTTAISTAQIGDEFFAKYTFPSSGADRYVFNGFTGSGNGLSDPTTETANVAKFTMGYSNVTVTANLIAATPTFTGTWSNMDVFIGQNFTYTPGTYTPSGATVEYTFNNDDNNKNTTGSFTAPSTPGNYTLTITITNQPYANFTAKTATRNVNIKVSYNETTVTYYVDMHDNVFDGNPTLSIVQNAGDSASPRKDADNEPYSAALVKQGNSTVYSVSEMKTPIISGNDLYINITFGSNQKTVKLAASKVGALAASREIWLEAVNEESFTLSLPTEINSTPAVANGYRRIYLAKPYSWQTAETAWENIGIYYWNDNGYEVGWNSGAHMTYLGSDGTGANNYHYYYADIPKAHEGNKINNIIFQGWYTNTSSGEYDKAQTGDIKGFADSANFFVLSKDGGSFIGTRGDDVTLPAYTRHARAINANVTEEGAINIAPGGVPTGAVVKYTSSETSVVTVANNGDVTLQGSGTATITVEIRSSLGALITSGTPDDTMSFTVEVNIKDPSKFEGFSIMSLNSAVYSFSVKDDSGVYPGYFDIDEVVVTVSGLPRYGTSVQSAIITPGNNISYTEDNVQKTAKASFTVRYAAQNNDFTYQNTASYDNITLTATVVSKSIKRADGERYGFKKWTLNNEDYSGGVKKTTITDGKETVRTTNMNLSKPDGSFSPTGSYVAEFEQYDYVDVIFTFNYQEYVPQVVTVDGKTMTNYFYDPTWAGSGNPNAHTSKTHTSASFEVRKATADTVTNEQLAAAALQAIEVKPQSNYYNYEIDSDFITKTKTGDYTATATVTLQKSPRTYQVYLNGTPFGSPVTYQAYATDSQEKDPHVDTASDWYVADDSSSGASVVNAPLVATNTTTYRFRVKGDTYLRTVPSGSADFNRSEVDFSHYEVTHREKTVIVDGEPQTLSLEYLLQNFYIADFFDRNQVIDPANNLPYDDATFVGGGVVYYSMRDNAPNSKTVDAGYVTAGGVANENAIKDMLRGHIEANYNSTLADAVGTEDAMRVAYGTKIDVTQDEINGRTTGMIYRYLPFENCTVDDSNNITTTVNSDTFRYSNALQSYQYVYASGNENKVTNNGRDMRLYSYYVYSYLTYDQETNVPQTKYEIILSNNYADASTYWAGNQATN